MNCDGKVYTNFDDPEDIEFPGGSGHIKCKENRHGNNNNPFSQK
ncbi:hypothetical protein U27_05835 [Candidatus Vecturithrix granuli]|uniref:Uncharacterized protein n=1 Tax=Vecturithrix granuli TaxID=1499967 RepID=A0A081C2Q5_VECG1|nr:hypothetical protein U27_05835 [Candidatus Vecturithrix granuli]